MKRLLLVLCLALCVLLAGCDTECGEGECQYWPTITTTEPTTATTAELQRYRVEVFELVGDDGVEAYIVSKDGYTIGGIYMLETDQMLAVGQIVYVVVIDEYNAVLFSDFIDDRVRP